MIISFVLCIERLEDLLHKAIAQLVLLALVATSAAAQAADIPIQEFLALQKEVQLIDELSRTPPEHDEDRCAYYTELNERIFNYFDQRRPIYQQLQSMDFSISLRVEMMAISSALRPALVKKQARVRILIAKIVNWDNQVVGYDRSTSKTLLCPAG